MGVGYCTSALHRISYLEPISGSRARGDTPAFLKFLPPGIIWDDGPRQFRSPKKMDIADWRERVSTKYRSRLGGTLSWDEDDEFNLSEDVATSEDVLLRYVAAVLEERGPQSATHALAGAVKPSPEERHRVFATADERGPAGIFPQLLLGARYWLPFEHQMVIEELDWEGNMQRFGSTIRLDAELQVVRAFIASADPLATAWTAKRVGQAPNLLAAAWRASDTISGLCSVALARRLPLWTTG